MQRAMVTRQDERMPYVPRKPGSGCQAEVLFVISPNGLYIARAAGFGSDGVDVYKIIEVREKAHTFEVIRPDVCPRVNRTKKQRPPSLSATLFDAVGVLKSSAILGIVEAELKPFRLPSDHATPEVSGPHIPRKPHSDCCRAR